MRAKNKFTGHLDIVHYSIDHDSTVAIPGPCHWQPG